MYPHQHEGFNFLWENLAGTAELSGLKKLDKPSGGGCIISHAPGTGKTLLTIVFIQSFLKKFPKCCPLIVAPATMLLTWEAEFKKWQVGFSFDNLNNSENMRNERINRNFRQIRDFTRETKIRSWSSGGIVLGVSYSLFQKLVGNKNKKNMVSRKIGNLLLDIPELVVLDEGHTPRNQTSNIWNTLLKLKTKNRVILSGTPFQNNFRELFNTLRLVRPAMAIKLEKEKVFADMIQPRNKKKASDKSTSKDIAKLKKIISPFVHVHKGHILEDNLPGLKQSVVILNPFPLQKSFIENLGDLPKTFEYEHKVALVSVHPSLILHSSLSEKDENLMNKQELKKVRLCPDVGVKTKFVVELIRLSVSLNEKVLIFSQYIRPLKLLNEQITHTFAWNVGKEVMMLKGGLHQKDRQMIINEFNDPNSKAKVLLASTKTCSEGIHLVGASRVVLLDVDWNPAVEKQAISRAYRLGQKKVVHTYHLMVAGTTEEEKYDVQVEKGRLAEMVFSSSGEEPKNKHAFELNDVILEEMVVHPKLKDMFKKIKYPEN
ncbi:SNF2 domain-containing protein CLASSY 3 [Tanacetum coccineum]